MPRRAVFAVVLAVVADVLMFGMKPRTAYYVFVDGEFRGLHQTHYPEEFLTIADVSTTSTVTVILYGDTVLTGVEKTPKAKEHIRFRPNPFDGTLLINCDEAVELRIYDVAGRQVQVLQLEPGENRVTLDVAAGVYFWATKGAAGKFVRVQ